MLRHLNFIALLGSVAWCGNSFGWEPLVTAIVLLGTYIKQLNDEKETDEKEPVIDLDRQSRVLEITRELQAQGLTIAQLHSIRDRLENRRHAEVQMPELPSVSDALGEAPMTQAAMNRLAGTELQIAEIDLRAALDRARLALREDDVRLPKLEKAARAWRRYAIAEAEFVASIAEGGTIRPLLYLSELESLCRERIARLLNEIEQNN